MGLGPYPAVSLADARRKADKARSQVAQGIDPLTAAAAEKRLTFREAAEALIESKRPGWRNAKHAAQWASTLERYVHPSIGDRHVSKIQVADVLAVLKPIWTSKTETASRVRQRVEAVLDYARAHGYRQGDNPARWRGHLDHMLPKPSAVKSVEHHKAQDWRTAPVFMAQLESREGVAPKALAFIILTAARSDEVRSMRWGEVDMANAIWVVPPSRIKAGKEHRVPLCGAALAILGQRGVGGTDQLVFESEVKRGKPLSDVSVTKVMRRMGYESITTHGWRSTFRDWAGESSEFAREVIEAALAHQIKDKAEAAYARGDLFDKRRALMAAWSSYLSRPSSQDLSTLNPLRG